MSVANEPSTTTSLFSKLTPSVRDNTVGAALGDIWLPGSAWDGVAALLATDDITARRGLEAFLVELADHVDAEGGWQALLLDLAAELE
jgi:hypothetical protein